jgi:hypothetical protein
VVGKKALGPDIGRRDGGRGSAEESMEGTRIGKRCRKLGLEAASISKDVRGW